MFKNVRFTIIVTLGIFSSVTFSQDSYQDQEIQRSKCEKREDCLQIDNQGYRFIPIYNRENELKGHRLNTSSTLYDVSDRSMCFSGNADFACRILSSLAGTTNFDYSQGGHVQVNEFECKSAQRSVKAEVEFKTDYDSDRIFEVLRVKKCHF